MKAKGEVEALKTITDFKNKPLAMLQGQTPGLRRDPPTALCRLPVVWRKVDKELVPCAGGGKRLTKTRPLSPGGGPETKTNDRWTRRSRLAP